MSRRLQAPPSGEYDISCPGCRKRFSSKLVAGWNNWQCLKCSRQAKLLLATVRAKRGKNENLGTLGFWRRNYSVRYVDSSGEGLLQFDSKSPEDIELRSRDVMIAVFPKNITKRKRVKEYPKKPAGIYNISIRRYFSLR